MELAGHLLDRPQPATSTGITMLSARRKFLQSFLHVNNLLTKKCSYLSVTATGQDAGASISTPLRNLVPGQDYVVSMYWRLNWWAYANVCSYVFFIDDQEHTNTVQMMNGWQQLSASFTAPKADPELKIQLWCSAIPDNGESDWEPLVNAYVDDVAIAESN